MGKINLGRVIIGGIVAGVIVDVVEYVLNAIVLADRWNAVAAAHSLAPVTSNAIILFNIIGLVTGIAAVWTYAAIRSRFGEGPGTAVTAALLTWVVGYFLPDLANAVMGIFPVSLTVTIAVVGLFEIVIATLAGAFIYRESGATEKQVTGAPA